MFSMAKKLSSNGAIDRGLGQKSDTKIAGKGSLVRQTTKQTKHLSDQMRKSIERPIKNLGAALA